MVELRLAIRGCELEYAEDRLNMSFGILLIGPLREIVNRYLAFKRAWAGCAFAFGLHLLYAVAP